MADQEHNIAHDKIEIFLCKKCDVKKLLIEFHKDCSRKDNRSPYCKLCVNTYKKKDWNDNKETLKKRHKISRDKRKDKQKIYNKNYGILKKKQISIQKKIYAKANQEKIRSRNQCRRTRMMGGIVEKFLDIQIFERDHWICQICLGKVNKRLKHPHSLSKSLDHVIPIANGGYHTWQNVVLVHLGCNIIKGNRLLTQQQRLF